MPNRIRHCVECPKCRIRYLIAFSPYRNGSHLVPTMPGSSEEYTLYCACLRPSFISRWRWSEVKACEISRAAHNRGYGTVEEIMEVNNRPQEEWSFDVAKYFDLRPTEKERNSR